MGVQHFPGGGGPLDPYMFSNTGPETLKNNNATKLAFNVRSSSARQLNTIQMVFYSPFDDGPVIVLLARS